jgi:O-antigen/teichoic acid export membrane protein
VALNTAVQLAGRALLLAIGLGSVAILTRYLGPRRYGQYGLAFSYTQLFGVLADVGIFTVVVRELSKAPERTEELVGNAFTLRLALSLVAVALAVGVSLALPYEGSVRVAIAIAGLALCLDLLVGSLTAAFQARLLMGYAVIAQVVGRVLALGAVAAVATLGLGLYGAVATASLGAAATLALSGGFARRLIRVRPRLQRRVWRQLLAASAVLGLALAINQVYLRADTLIVSLYRSYREVGLYAVGYRIADLVVAIPAVLLASVFPVVSRYVAAGDARLPAVIQLVADAFTILGVAIAVGGAILARPIIELAAGAGFADPDATTSLALLLAAGALVSLNGLFGFALIAKARQAQALWLNVSALALNLSLNFLLVPPFGIVAAAATTLAGEVLILGGSFLLMRRHFGFFVHFRVLPRALLAAAAMSAALWPLRHGPAIPLIALGAAVYLAVLWAVGGIDREVLRRLRAPA